MPIPFPVFFSKEERQAIDHLAARFGVTFDEMAEALASGGIAHRFKKNTGKLPAKVYGIRRDKK